MLLHQLIRPTLFTFNRLTGPLTYLALICFLPLLLPAQKNAAPAVDFSILEKIEDLRPFLNQDQRIAIIQAENLIAEGTSDVRSGTSLANRRPSALDPNVDLRPVHARGAEYIKRGEAKIQEGRLAVVRILEAAEQEQKELQIEQTTKFDFNLTVASSEAAIENVITPLLKACREKNYTRVFYESVYLTQGETSTEAPPEIRNSVYDTVVRLDGTYFSVSLAINLSFAPDQNAPGGYAFSFENEAVFAGEKKALLAIEWLTSPRSNQALLYARAVDMDTHQVVASEVMHVQTASEFLKERAMLAAEDEEPWLPKNVTVRDHARTIEQLASLPEPYHFIIRGGKELPRDRMAEALLTATITKNSDLIVLASDFIESIYLNADDNAAEATEEALWTGLANAEIQLIPAEGANNNYHILARGDEAARTVRLGTLALVFPETEESIGMLGK